MTGATRITLLERLRSSRDSEAWHEFVDLYDGMIIKWLLNQGVEPNDADDVRQEVMTTVNNEIAHFEHNGREGAFRNWLRQITANRLHRLWQKKKSKGQQLTGPDLGSMSDQLADNRSRMTLMWDKQHNQFILDRLLSKLSSRFHVNHISAFQRIVLKNEEPQQVADDFGMTLGAVRVAQHRVLRALKDMGQGLLD
jgi:RNA polymerase sigma factor (sigma-70 family)